MADETRNHVTERLDGEIAVRQLAGRLVANADAIADATKLVATSLKDEAHRLAPAARKLVKWAADAQQDAARLRRHLKD